MTVRTADEFSIYYASLTADEHELNERAALERLARLMSRRGEAGAGLAEEEQQAEAAAGAPQTGA